MHVIQGLRANITKAHVAHPLPALRGRVLKTSRGLDQHVEARQQRVSLDATPIVDERIVHDERTPHWERLMGPRQQHCLGWKIPIVQDASHDVNVGLGQGIGKEITGVELQPV